MKIFKIHRIIQLCKQCDSSEDSDWAWLCKLLGVDYIYFTYRSSLKKPYLQHKHFIYRGHQRRIKFYKFMLYWGWNCWDFGAKKKLWVDDLREPPSNEWVVARTYEKALTLLEKNHYQHISLDHDLGQPDGKDGYGIVKWLVERKMDGLHTPDIYHLHTANPVGYENMDATIKRYLM